MSVTLIAGLGYGDEGKGTTVDHLARSRPTSLVVRYNGGAQAAHNVVTDDGRHHTFAQLGAGSFAGVPTLLSRHALVDPIALLAEKRHFGDAPTIHVERDALVTTPFHVATNRLREMARSGRHGSCGMGIGETREDALAGLDVIRVGDLADVAKTREKLHALRARKLRSLRDILERLPARADRELAILADEETIETCIDRFAIFRREVNVVDEAFLAGVLREDAEVIFEGAQGVLLDQDFGFQPHTTWTDITFANAEDLLARAGFVGETRRLGVLRAYVTRHGAGPFVTEDPALHALSDHDHNQWGEWQQGFRSGAFDLVATRYALDVIGGVDAIVMTNLDRIRPQMPVAIRYDGADDPAFFDGARIRVRRPFALAHQEALTRALFVARPVYEVRDASSPLRYALEICADLDRPLAVASFGPQASAKIDRISRIAPRPRKVSALRA